jgi:hypothetical protein
MSAVEGVLTMQKKLVALCLALAASLCGFAGKAHAQVTLLPWSHAVADGVATFYVNPNNPNQVFEQYPNGGVWTYAVTARNGQYVELHDSTRRLYIRLYQTQAYWYNPNTPPDVNPWVFYYNRSN